MQKAVIIYSTTDGQTKRICEFLMQKLETKMKIDLFSIDEIDQIEFKFYDKIIIGASIRYGKHSPKLFKFIEENIDVLKAKLVKKGFTDEKANVFARELVNVARSYGVSPYSLVNEVNNDINLNDLGSFVINSALRFGYQTGKINPSKPNKYIARAILK